MDPLNYQLKPYNDIPLMTKQDFYNLQKSKRVVLWKELILDLTDFEHPGYNQTIDEFLGKDLSEAYSARLHSLNADILICHRAVGRLESSPLSSESRSFYTSIRNNDLVKNHEQVVSKMNLGEPLMNSLRKLSQAQFNILTQIPKYFTQPNQIKYQQGKWQNFMSSTYFWISAPLFTVQLILLIIWLFNSWQIMEIVSSGYIAVFGCLAWTLTEYYFHRIQLHKQFPEGHFQPHLIHHCFPNLRNRIALSFWKNNMILTGMYIFIRIAFGELLALQFMIGFITSMIIYDSIHYYCHFGPETQIQWLKNLRIKHLKHHYRNSKINFGVTTSLWDIVFNTIEQKQKKV